MRTNFVTAMSIVLSCMAFSSCAQTTTFSIGGKTTETITIDKNDKIVTRQFNVRNFDGISTSSVIDIEYVQGPQKVTVTAGCFRQEFHPHHRLHQKESGDILKRTHTAEGYRILSGAETDHLFRLCRHFS